MPIFIIIHDYKYNNYINIIIYHRDKIIEDKASGGGDIHHFIFIHISPDI